MTSITPFPRHNPRAHAVPADLPTLRDDWLARIEARGGARNTLAAYRADVGGLIAFLARHDVTLVQLVGERLLNRWLDDGVLHLGWSQRTASRKLTAVRGFLDWCRAEGYLQHEPAAHLRIRFRPRRVVAPEMDALRPVIAAIGTRDAFDLRDRAVLLLLLDAGLRAGEAAGLDLAPTPGDAHRSAHYVSLPTLRVHVRPKGGGDGAVETVGIEAQTAEAVRAWLRKREQVARPGEQALFVNRHGRRFSRQSLYVMVVDRGAAAGVKGLHPHLFRHRRIGDVVEKLGLDTGCALARHRSKATTANVYGEHAAEVQRAAIRDRAPLGRMG